MGIAHELVPAFKPETDKLLLEIIEKIKVVALRGEAQIIIKTDELAPNQIWYTDRKNYLLAQGFDLRFGQGNIINISWWQAARDSSHKGKETAYASFPDR